VRERLYIKRERLGDKENRCKERERDYTCIKCRHLNTTLTFDPTDHYRTPSKLNPVISKVTFILFFIRKVKLSANLTFHNKVVD